MADVGVAPFMAGVAALIKAGHDISKSSPGKELEDHLVQFQQALIKLNSDAVSIQTQNLSLLHTNDELKKELQSMKDWSADAVNYETLEVAPGGFVHVEKGRVTSMESTPKFCSNCFYQRIKTLLVQTNEDHRTRGLSCHRCKTKFTIRAYIDGG